MKPLKTICQRGAVVLCMLLSACATPMAERSDPRDPYENLNRKVFVVNQVFDQVLLKPVARGYSNYAPNFVQTTIGNFFGNLADVWTAVNNFLQGKPREGIQDTGRVAVNTVSVLRAWPMWQPSWVFPSIRKISGRRWASGG